MNLFVLGAARRSVASLEGLAHPWSLLQKRLGSMRAESLRGESLLWGAVYLASGVVRPSQLWVCAVFTLGLGWATVLRMGRSSVPVALLQV